MASITFTLPEVVVVTGTASGLGFEVGALLLENDAIVLGVDVAESELQGRERYIQVTGSIVEAKTWTTVLGKVRETGNTRIGLVTSAAVLDVGTIPESSEAMIEKTMAVNVTGTALALGALIPEMEKHGGGQAVAIASVNATLAEQQLALYNASKAAARQLARTAALDHARKGVRVNVLSPGPMMAGLFKRHLESAADSATFLSTRAGRQPQGHILDAKDVARAVAFLLSDGSAAILGADVIADGGLTAGFDFRTGAEGASV